MASLMTASTPKKQWDWGWFRFDKAARLSQASSPAAVDVSIYRK